MALVNAFEILGILESASTEEIRRAYRTRAMQFHPDRGGMVEHFVRVQQAFDLLMDEPRRELLGRQPKFERLPLRIQPSLSRATTILFENLSKLEDKLEKSKATK